MTQPTRTETIRPAWAATDKQRWRLLNRTIVDHEVPEAAAATVRQLVELEAFTKKDASTMIDALEALPRRAKPVPKVVTPDKMRVSPLSDLPDTRFAIPVGDLSALARQLAGGGDFLIGEMKTYKGWRYMNVLKGSHPVFSRTKVVNKLIQGEIAALLRGDLLGYVRNYGTEYKCCSSCGAELSDTISKDLQLGPECRKKFGL